MLHHSTLSDKSPHPPKVGLRSPSRPHVLPTLSDKSPCLFAEALWPAFSPDFSPASWPAFSLAFSLALSSELSGFHSKFYRHLPSRFEVQELESWETGKISVEGDKATATGNREGGQVGIGPHAVREINCGGEGME